MDEKPDEIMNHIESQRDQLGRNLNELETRVKRTTDWRAQVDRNPMMAVGVALGGGLLLGSIVGRWCIRSGRSSWSSSTAAKNYSSANLCPRRRRPRPLERALAQEGHRSTGEQRRKASDTLEQHQGCVDRVRNGQDEGIYERSVCRDLTSTWRKPNGMALPTAPIQAAGSSGIRDRRAASVRVPARPKLRESHRVSGRDEDGTISGARIRSHADRIRFEYLIE